MTDRIAAGRARGRRRQRARPMSEINVTPFVDVMLVLLIVFMVAAPLLSAGVPVDLPRGQAKPLAIEKEPVTVTIDTDGTVFIKDSRVALDDLVSQAQADAVGGDLDERIYVRGDKAVELRHDHAGDGRHQRRRLQPHRPGCAERTGQLRPHARRDWQSRCSATRRCSPGGLRRCRAAAARRQPRSRRSRSISSQIERRHQRRRRASPPPSRSRKPRARAGPKRHAEEPPPLPPKPEPAPRRRRRRRRPTPRRYRRQPPAPTAAAASRAPPPRTAAAAADAGARHRSRAEAPPRRTPRRRRPSSRRDSAEAGERAGAEAAAADRADAAGGEEAEADKFDPDQIAALLDKDQHAAGRPSQPAAGRSAATSGRSMRR